MLSNLINKGFAYEENQHIYFEVKKFKDYGKLSNKNLDELIAGSRVEVSDNKKNSQDFILWKPSKISLRYIYIHYGQRNFCFNIYNQ